MTELTANEFFTKKHARLWRIASIANIAAWIAFIGFIVIIAAKVVETQTYYRSVFFETFSKELSYFLNVVVDLADTFLRGVVYTLVLKGISLGLRMIVETDLNYRGKSQEESHE